MKRINKKILGTLYLLYGIDYIHRRKIAWQGEKTIRGWALRVKGYCERKNIDLTDYYERLYAKH